MRFSKPLVWSKMFNLNSFLALLYLASYFEDVIPKNTFRGLGLIFAIINAILRAFTNQPVRPPKWVQNLHDQFKNLKK